jgi:hypothetical protein
MDDLLINLIAKLSQNLILDFESIPLDISLKILNKYLLYNSTSPNLVKKGGGVRANE